MVPSSNNWLHAWVACIGESRDEATKDGFMTLVVMSSAWWMAAVAFRYIQSYYCTLVGDQVSNDHNHDNIMTTHLRFLNKHSTPF